MLDEFKISELQNIINSAIKICEKINKELMFSKISIDGKIYPEDDTTKEMPGELRIIYQQVFNILMLNDKNLHQQFILETNDLDYNTLGAYKKLHSAFKSLQKQINEKYTHIS